MRLCVMTFNIHHGEGRDGVVDLERTARVIAAVRPDLVGLQEVERFFLPRSFFCDQIKTLAHKLGMEYAFGPTLTHPPFLPWRRGQYGNAVLSRYPILGVNHWRFPSRREPRGLLLVRVKPGGRPVRFAVTHLGLEQRERFRQVARILAYLRPLRWPTILVGDWNALPEAREVQAVGRDFQDAWAAVAAPVPPNGATFGGGEGREARIDYVFASAHFTVISYQALPTEASDHRPVIVELAWREEEN